MNRKLIWGLVLILGLAAFLRFFRYDLADVITDEVFYGYRSIGLVDSLNSPFQPTPFEWFDPVPGWARLSFHDHPPLGFWIQHLFFKIFGNNLLGLRLPFILSGIASVLLVFLIARRLFKKDKPALLAASFLAVNTYHVWISRIGLEESLVIFFLLLAIWLFLKTLEDFRWWYGAVVVTGMAVLVKYTAVILLPIFLTYLLMRRRDLLSWPRIILSAFLLLVILSPVIVYNFKLYQARGHFDYQISYFLKQNVPEWENRPGREVGGLVQKFKNFGVRSWANFGPLFSVGAIFSLLVLFRRSRNELIEFLAVCLGFLILLVLVIGPQERFLAMLSPFIAILLGGFLAFYLSHQKVFWLVLGLLILGEFLYAANSLLLSRPFGQEVWNYSLLRRESNVWGYNQLENYLDETMEGFYPSGTFPLKFSFARDLQQAALAKAKAEGKKPLPILFVTDTAMFDLASLWYVTRHVVYDAWPMLTDNSYLEVIREDPEFFAKQGIHRILFIKTDKTLLRREGASQAAEILEKGLQQSGNQPFLVLSPRAGPAFKIYTLAE